MKWKSSHTAIGMGLIASLLSLALFIVQFGNEDQGATLLLFLEIGILLIFLGLGLRVAESQGKTPFSNPGLRFLNSLYEMPPILWVLLGFSIPFMFLLIKPMFWNMDRQFAYIQDYLPTISKIGHDLAYNTDAIKLWLTGGSPYSLEDHFYPPAYLVIFAPILLIPQPYAYYLISTVTLLSFSIQTLLFPSLLNHKKEYSLVAFIILTGILSYGMQFELERGQFNVLTMLLCLTAIYLFHYHPSFRLLAYLLFTVAIQLKLFPAIFILMFVDELKDWKGNLKRFVTLGLINIALLFVLGYPMFLTFLENASTRGGGYVYYINHSVTSFAHTFLRSKDFLHGHFPKRFVAPTATLLYIYFGLCLLIVLARAYKDNLRGLNPHLLMVCTIGAMILPPVSIDYKLPMLAAPLAIILSTHSIEGRAWQRVGLIALFIITSAAYSTTLFSPTYRTGILQNALPMLFVILTTTTIMNQIGGMANIRNH